VGSLAAIQQTLQGNLPTDVPVNFTTTGAFGNFGAGISYTEPGTGAASVASALLLTGSGLPITNYARAFDALSGATLPGFPTKIQGIDFLGVPAIADVSGDGRPDLLIGGDSSALHAFNSDGSMASGFPKFMTGWEIFGPSVGDIDGNGRNEVAIATREGYIMVWNTSGKAGDDQWWSYRHDERNSGQYGLDTRPPGVVRNARIENGQLLFLAPGGDWYQDAVDHYTVQFTNSTGGAETRTVGAGGPAGSLQTVVLPPNATSVRVRAVDSAGNLGGWVSVPASG
jgi:hypothetical protein